MVSNTPNKNTPSDGFVSSSLRFLSGFAEAPWFDGGTRLS